MKMAKEEKDGKIKKGNMQTKESESKEESAVTGMASETVAQINLTVVLEIHFSKLGEKLNDKLENCRPRVSSQNTDRKIGAIEKNIRIRGLQKRPKSKCPRQYFETWIPRAVNLIVKSNQIKTEWSHPIGVPVYNRNLTIPCPVIL